MSDSGQSPQSDDVDVRKTKTERLEPEAIFTSERDERLDPLRQKITKNLIWLLAAAMVLHAGLTFWASYGTPDASKNISAVFNIWVPVISGLVSAAVTWFLPGKNRGLESSLRKLCDGLS